MHKSNQLQFIIDILKLEFYGFLWDNVVSVKSKKMRSILSRNQKFIEFSKTKDGFFRNSNGMSQGGLNAQL